MNYTIENYQQCYIDEVIRIWNNNLNYDVINRERFMNRIILDDNFDEKYFLLAIQNNSVIGFVFGIKRKFPYLERGLEESRAWINIIAVDTPYQHKKVGSALINELENRFEQAGVKEITLCAYSPNYLNPGIDKRYSKGIHLFESLGYLCNGEAVSMRYQLWDYFMKEETKKQIKDNQEHGIYIKPYQSSYCLKLLQFLSKEFGGGWKRNALMAMQKQEAEKTIFIAVDQHNEIIGFVMRKIDGNDARFGPIGVSNEIRSRGLGGLLLETMMQDMKEREIYEMYFLWTHGKAMDFYLRHGFEVIREYNLYRKVI